MVGCFIIMFVKQEHQFKIRGLKKCKVRTGLSGMAGNKGGVAIRFCFEDTAFAFINVHLESGQNAMVQRLENVREVFHEVFNDFALCNTQRKSYHDYKFFFGDMNFRINLPYEETVQLIKRKDYNRLIQFDQLSRLKRDPQSNSKIKNFNEGQLNFDPTYKFDPNTNVYDTSPKMRVPAWCDRILMCRDPKIQDDLIHDRMSGDDVSASLPSFYSSR